MSKGVKYKETEVIYSHSGSGQVIVLLHGFLEERGMWNGIAPQLQKNHTVITIDLLGHGDTGCIGYVHSMEDQAEAVALVLEKEKAKKCIVIGHSMGGYVALAFADKYPEMVDGLVLFHSTSYADSEQKIRDRERVIRLVQQNEGVYINAAIPFLVAERNQKRLKTEIEAAVNKALKFSQQGIIANIRGMIARSDRSSILANAPFLKLIIHGLEDPIISLESIKEQVILNKNIRFELLDKVGHMGYLESPDQCFKIISDFCATKNG